VPSLASLNPGNDVNTLIVPATSNVITSDPVFELAQFIASRNDPGPLSSRFVTVELHVTVHISENSDVFPAGSVAVELRTKLVTSPGTISIQVPLPVTSVKELVVPRKVSPSPKPLGSPKLLLKISMSKLVLVVEFIVPSIVVLNPSKLAAVMIGKF